VVTIAGDIVLAIVLIIVFSALVAGMFSGFAKSPGQGCLTMILFGFILFALAMYVFG
jgi:hypothetical protein